MRIGVPKERLVNETRVAIAPNTIKQLLKLGFTVAVEYGAGELANFSDETFIQAGADMMDKIEVWKSPIILKINAPEKNEIILLNSGTLLISFIWPTKNIELIKNLATRNITVIAMDLIPRISRVQSLDALSSMANIAGYRAIIEAAYEFGRFFPGQITAAGNISPAKVMVIGAGIAGLAAIRTAKSLGAIVRAFDIRPEVEEQVHSIGAKFLKLDYKDETRSNDDCRIDMTSKDFTKEEMELFAVQAKEVDIIVTTVFTPGKSAPKLLTRDIINTMKPGSIVVDLAAQSGGNCEYTTINQVVTTTNSVKVIGYTNLPGRLPTQSSQLYSTNLVNLLKLLCKNKDGNIAIDFEDTVVSSMTVVREGKIIWPTPSLIQGSIEPEKKEMVVMKKKTKPIVSRRRKCPSLILAIVLFGCLSTILPKEFFSHFTVFALSCVIGYYVTWNVSRALHTPLMSVTNAISGIIIIGALLQIKHGGWISFLSFVAILISTINIFGGFTITHRMLKMFRKK